jgi:hypothetical protein
MCPAHHTRRFQVVQGSTVETEHPAHSPAHRQQHGRREHRAMEPYIMALTSDA